MNREKYDLSTDVAILGAGPAGVSTALFLARAGIEHIIFDQTTFPREKICGDALSGKVVDVLKKIDPVLRDKLEEAQGKFIPSRGAIFGAPNGQRLELPFQSRWGETVHASGFIGKRLHFDNLLVNMLHDQVTRKEFGAKVTDVHRVAGGVEIRFKKNGEERCCLAKMVVGAEGDRSLVARKFAGFSVEPEHYSAGVRTYFKNITGFHEQNYIELYFFKELLPGYFWLFPLPGNLANVGIGMPSQLVRRGKLNLKAMMLRIIKENPEMKERFKNTVMVDRIKGWRLPLGTKKRKLSGDRFLLVGDAASLIDPFTGEGVGNALTSGMVAADIIKSALARHDFSAKFLSVYDAALYDQLWDELQLSGKLLKLVKKSWLVNLVVNKANKSKTLRETIGAMFEDLDMRDKLRSP
ncbi:MAG TPA: geranylgeranyl reductase family protein, partial [Bacteroidetes bacterium]|nr:geranylgeranyl reductase family protein [Bacteroidota bacterium]